MTQLFRDKASTTLRSLIAGCALAIALVWTLAWQVSERLHQVESDAAHREIASLATLLADHADRTMQGADLLLTLLTGRVERALADGVSSETLHRILREGIAGMPYLRRGVLLSADGTATADSASASVLPFSSGDREHFRMHRERPDVGMFLSDPLIARIDGKASIILSRRLDHADGQFAGTISAHVDPDYFAALFRTAEIPQHTRIDLVKLTGVTLASVGPPRGSTTAMPPRFDAVDLSEPGLATRASFVDPPDALEGERLGFYAIARTYPLAVVVTRPRDVAEASSLKSQTIVGIAAIAVTFAIVAMGLLLGSRMRSLEERFREGIERMGDGFMLWDCDSRLVAWNKRIDEILAEMSPLRLPGVRFEEYIRAGAGTLFQALAPEAVAREVERRIARFHEAGAPWDFRTDSGRTIEVEETRTRSGGTVSIYRDVTVRRRQQEEIEKALSAERAANLVQRRFVSMASHEFRTPLAVIDGAAQRVLDQAQSDRATIAARMKRIRDSVTRMTGLIDRMLSSARLDEGRITVTAGSVDLAALLRHVVERQRQISAGFHIKLSLPAEPVMLEGDGPMLDQVFTNLLSNAVKYSGRSRHIDVEARLLDDAARPIEVLVADHGVGIPADEIGQLFTRFFRARTANGISGTGIGLHLARELVQLHGGTIAVRSAVGEGTTFTIRLPTHGVTTASSEREAA